MRGAQLTAGYTVNTYSKPPLYYTHSALSRLSCRVYARRPCCARHTHSAWWPSPAVLTHGCRVPYTAHTVGPGGPLPHADRRDARQTRLTNQPASQPASRFASTQLYAGKYESFGAHHKNLNEIDPRYQQQQCRPITLVSGGIRFVRIFAEVPRRGGVKRQWGCRQRPFLAFSLAFFVNFRDEASIIMWRYAVRRRLFSDPRMHDLE